MTPKKLLKLTLSALTWPSLLLIVACSKGPSGTYVSGGQRKQVGTGDESEIMEQNKFSEQEFITFLPNGKLTWEKKEGDVSLKSDGTWEKQDDIILVQYTYKGEAKKRQQGDTIFYKLRKSRDSEGKEEYSLKSVKHNDSPFRPIPTVKNLWRTAFHKVE